MPDDTELQLDSDTMDLGEEVEEALFPSRTSVQGLIETHRTLDKMRSLLAGYGLSVEKLSDAELVAKYNKIMKLAQEQTQVLSKGVVLDRLAYLVDKYVKDGFVGEFFLNSEEGVHRAQGMGWELVIDKKANKESPTGTADGRVLTGDLVLMQKPEDEYVADSIAKAQRRANRRKRHEAIAKGKASGNVDPFNPQGGGHREFQLRPMADLTS